MPDFVFMRRTPRREARGRRWPLMRSLLLTLGGALLLTPIAISLVPAEDAPRVITDTPDYCHQLYIQASAEEHQTKTAGLAEIRNLVEQGAEMCAAGQIRGGIIRLRRALAMMRPPPPPPPRRSE